MDVYIHVLVLITQTSVNRKVLKVFETQRKLYSTVWASKEKNSSSASIGFELVTIIFPGQPPASHNTIKTRIHRPKVFNSLSQKKCLCKCIRVAMHLCNLEIMLLKFWNPDNTYVPLWDYYLLLHLLVNCAGSVQATLHNLDVAGQVSRLLRALGLWNCASRLCNLKRRKLVCICIVYQLHSVCLS